MELAIAPDLVAEAEYWPGEADMPAILILHGFLQTREFPTVHRLAESLADEGFSVLTPSLTLGLSHRRQSLACEAIHTHDMEQDVAELNAWVVWLSDHAGKAPIVVGHSTGGVHVAAMLDLDTAAPVAKAVLVSTAAFGEFEDGEDVAAARLRANAAAERGETEIGTYPLGFCTDYVTTPEAYLSYLAWDHDRLQAVLIRSEVPVTVLFGEKDERIRRDWLEDLRAGGVDTRGVPGAGHFFDLAHEFDLFDEMVEVIVETGRG